MFNIFIGIIWQTALVILPIVIIIKAHISLIITIAVIVITCLILKKTWYNRLEES